MRPTIFQHAELRDEDDQIVQQGTYGKNSPLSNATNDGWIDYVMNNLEWLYDETQEPSNVVTLTGNQTISDIKTFTSSPVAPTPAAGDDSTKVATTEFVHGELDGAFAGLAPLASPAFTGTPTAPTPTAGDDSTKIATTEYVQAELEDYLALTGGSITGDVDITGNLDVDGDSSIIGDLAVTGNISGDSINVKSGSVAPINTLQRSTAYSVDDIVYTSALNAKYYLLCVTAGTTAAIMPSFSEAGSNTEVTDGTVVWRVQTITSQEKAAGFPIGHEYFSMNPNIPQGSLPLIGGEYSRATYSDLWSWVQEQTGYLKTEAQWQALSTANNGNVPYYSDGDGSTTFRVPSLHCWIKGSDGSAQLVGSYLEAGLPNITGEIKATWQCDPMGISSTASYTIGACQNTWTANNRGGGEQWSGCYNVDIDASRSSSIYGNATTVVPESIVGMWLVKAYGTVVDTGTIDEQAYIDEQLAINVPAGCVQAFAGQTTPQGWLLCDGSAVSRTQYSRLFTVIGTTYGAGDGTDTFNLPNLTDKFIQGNATSGTEHSAGIPDIKGQFTVTVPNGFVGTGAFGGTAGLPNGGAPNAVDGYGYNFVASDGEVHNGTYSNLVYGKSDTVQPPSVTMRYIIKY